MKNQFKLFLVSTLIGLSSFSVGAADVAISAMPAASAIAGTEAIPIVKGGANVRTTPADIGTYLRGSIGSWSAAQTFTSPVLDSPTINTPTFTALGNIAPTTVTASGTVTGTVGAFSSEVAIASDARLFRDAANTLAQRNTTNAQTFRVYNTYTDASNYERAFVQWSSNVLQIGTEAAGTGSNRSIAFRLTGFNPLVLSASTATWSTEQQTQDVTPKTTGTYSLGVAARAWQRLYVDYTNTGTVGAVSINKAAGRVNIAAAGTSVVVTNSYVTAASKVFAVISTNDTTAVLKNVVPAAGSFTITLNAAATAQTSIDFFVVNAD